MSNDEHDKRQWLHWLREAIDRQNGMTTPTDKQTENTDGDWTSIQPKNWNLQWKTEISQVDYLGKVGMETSALTCQQGKETDLKFWNSVMDVMGESKTILTEGAV